MSLCERDYLRKDTNAQSQKQDCSTLKGETEHKDRSIIKRVKSFLKI